MPGRTLELDVDGGIRQAFGAVLGGDPAAEHRTHGPVGVGDRILQADFLLPFDGRLRSLDDLEVAHRRERMQRLAGPAAGPFLPEQQPGQVHAGGLGGRRGSLAHQQFGVSDDIG